MATVLGLGLNEPATHSVVKEKIEDWVKLSIEFATRKEEPLNRGGAKAPAPLAHLTTQSSTEEPAAAVLKEVKKGYDMLFIGLEQALPSTADTFNASIEKIVRDFKGALAIVVAKDKMPAGQRMRSMDILVLASGAEYSRRAGEV